MVQSGVGGLLNTISFIYMFATTMPPCIFAKQTRSIKTRVWSCKSLVGASGE